MEESVAPNCPSLEISFICILYPQFLWIIVCIPCFVSWHWISRLSFSILMWSLHWCLVPEEHFLFSLCHCPFQICTLDIQMLFILGGFSQYILFKYPQWVLPHWVLYSQHPMLLIIYFIFLTYLMPFDNGVLLTSNAVYTGGVSSQYVLFKYPQWVLPHWVLYSWHPMPFILGGFLIECPSQICTLNIQCHCLILKFKWSASISNLIL